MTPPAFSDKFSTLLTHSENGVEGQDSGKGNGARLCFPLNCTGGGQALPSLALGLTSSLSLGPLPVDRGKPLPRSLDGWPRCLLPVSQPRSSSNQSSIELGGDTSVSPSSNAKPSPPLSLRVDIYGQNISFSFSVGFWVIAEIAGERGGRGNTSGLTCKPGRKEVTITSVVFPFVLHSDGLQNSL